MKSTTLLMQLTAKEFWQDCQWLGAEKESKKQIFNWYSLEVKEVFVKSNWSGKNHDKSLQQQLSKKLQISLPVKDFFQCFAWDKQQKSLDKPKIAEKTESQHSKEQSLLSELAEFF